MNCEQANKVDMVAFLANTNLQPVKIRGNDYWYKSPLHEDRTPSFKVNSAKNTWFDFGVGKGGTLVDFVCAAEHCDVATALAKIALANPLQFSSFPPQQNTYENSQHRLAIIKVSDAITDNHLKAYLRQRNIDMSVASIYCKQVQYENAGKQFTAIGFKNNSGGYELRSPGFKGSASPKFVTWFDKGAQNVQVFEGFFDFLACQTMLQNRRSALPEKSTNILVLNSLSFFTRSLLLMEKHQHIHLFLDNDVAGDQCMKQIQQRVPTKVNDERNLYKGHKDISDWWTESHQQVRQQKRLGL
jgi:hypothetical protein